MRADDRIARAGLRLAERGRREQRTVCGLVVPRIHSVPRLSDLSRPACIDRMKLLKPQITVRDGIAGYSVRVVSKQGERELWYRLDREHAGMISERADAALCALIIPAMNAGEDIHVDGVVSERLYYNLSGAYQSVARSIMPWLKPVHILVSDVSASAARGGGVATGFSAGIDSFCALGDHHYGDPAPGYRLTHLLYSNVGSHGAGAGAERLFRERYDRLKPIAERMGLPFIAVNSNVDEFYKGFVFRQTHTPRSTSVAHMLQGGIARFMYASSHRYTDGFVGPTSGGGRSEAVTLPLLSSDTLDAFSVGAEYSRVEKTVRVAEITDSYNSLDVCVKAVHAGNCSRCWKCARTLLTLEIAGFLERYADSFDLDGYRSVRAQYIKRILRSTEPLEREIVEFARGTNYPLPLGARIAARLDIPRAVERARAVAGGVKRVLFAKRE